MSRLIVSDIDGCLTPEESVPWDVGAVAALAARIRLTPGSSGAVAPFTICTGRPQPYVEALMKLFDVKAPAIAENGAVIYTLADNRARFSAGLKIESVEGLRQVRAHFEQTLQAEFPTVRIQFGKEAQLSLFTEDTSCFPALKARIEAFEREAGIPPLTIQPSHFYLNISPRGVDKGAAVREVIAMMGLKREDAVGIGDTEGDLPLAAEVGWFACPANATGAVKAAADYVSPLPMLAGVLDILDQPPCRC